MQHAEPLVQAQVKPTKGKLSVKPKPALNVPMDVDIVGDPKPKGLKKVPKLCPTKKAITAAAISEDNIVVTDEPAPLHCILHKWK